ncbi:unnamed protein product [Didymodactylos carnosus]|nr:unnamed protein product [Didymodactylos carnosus]CAF4414776.1 unnamed protein product [Didymodactylos carnosus]
MQDGVTIYTCTLCEFKCFSMRNMRRHIRLHTTFRPYLCTPCKLSFKSYGNFSKHLKTLYHNQNMNSENKTTINWDYVDTKALEKQGELHSNMIRPLAESIELYQSSPIPTANFSNEDVMNNDMTNNLLEDLPTPNSHFVDDDKDELALIDPATFEELSKAAECLLNLQGLFYDDIMPNYTNETHADSLS